MRIAYFVPYLDPRPAGVGVYVDEVGRRLIARHSETLVYTPPTTELPTWLDASRVRHLPIGLPRFGAPGAQRKLARWAWLASVAQQQMKRDGIDVFFAPTPEAPVLGGVPSVVVVHDLTALEVPEAYRRSTVLETKYVTPLVLKRASRVVAVSENTKRDIVRRFSMSPGSITVVGEGYDAETFRPRDSTAVRLRFGINRYVLYAGTLSRHKNLDVVLEALAAAPPDLHFVITGRTDVGLRSELESKARSLGLDRRMHLVGYVSRIELAELMSGCAAFVYPSRYEGFGLAPLEAMACGAPVIASRVASLPEVVGDGGALVPPGEAWTEPLRRVLADSRDDWSKRARAQAARFDWDTAVEGLSTVLAEAMHRSRGTERRT